MTKAMRNDFGRQFSKKFACNEDLLAYKRRLFEKLKNTALDDIVNGYEDYVDSGNKFVPELPELLKFIRGATDQRMKQSKLAAESATIAALPAPTIECDPVEMLIAAKKAYKPIADAMETDADRLKQRLEVLKNHEAIITLAGSHVRHLYADSDHSCGVSGCYKAGTMTGGTTGGGNYYCKEHYRMS